MQSMCLRMRPDLCVRYCFDCNFSTTVTSVDLKLYTYFLLCLSLVSEDISKWHDTGTPIKLTFNGLFFKNFTHAPQQKCLTSECLS